MHNGLIDKHPAAIARCHGVADIVDAVHAGTNAWPRRRRPRRRPQRGGARHPRSRPADRPVAHEGHSRRRAGANRASPGRRPVEGTQSRDTGARPRDDRRGRREHRDRGLDARRRHRMADAEVRSRAGQLALCRSGHRGRPGAFAQAPTRTPICSGRFAAAAATSASRRRSNTTSMRSGRSSPAASSRIRWRARSTC